MKKLIDCCFLKKISPQLLKELYFGEHYIKCMNCKKMISGHYYRAKCNCQFCQSDNDEMCVLLPVFNNFFCKCPFCLVGLLYYCAKRKCFLGIKDCKCKYYKKI